MFNKQIRHRVYSSALLIGIIFTGVIIVFCCSYTVLVQSLGAELTCKLATIAEQQWPRAQTVYIREHQPRTAAATPHNSLLRNPARTVHLLARTAV